MLIDGFSNIRDCWNSKGKTNLVGDFYRSNIKILPEEFVFFCKEKKEEYKLLQTQSRPYNQNALLGKEKKKRN